MKEGLLNRLTELKTRLNNKEYQTGELNIKIIEDAIKVAGFAPSGANQQPWTYLFIQNNKIKEQIYHTINHNNTSKKQLLLIMKQSYGLKVSNDGTEEKIKHYYTTESTGLSVGFLLSAFHFLKVDYEILPLNNKVGNLLKRPINENPYLLIEIKQTNRIEDNDNNYVEMINKRRSVRHYLTKDFKQEILENLVDLVNDLLEKQFVLPHEFVLIKDQTVKQKIRDEAEKIEKRLYEELITKEWKESLSKLGTNWKKPHLTEAPFLIVIFNKNIQSNNSISNKVLTSIATGMLIHMIHYVDLSTLTYTPSPMNFLSTILNRENQTPLMVLPVGFRNEEFSLPNITRKDLRDYFITIE